MGNNYTHSYHHIPRGHPSHVDVTVAEVPAVLLLSLLVSEENLAVVLGALLDHLLGDALDYLLASLSAYSLAYLSDYLLAYSSVYLLAYLSVAELDALTEVTLV